MMFYLNKCLRIDRYPLLLEEKLDAITYKNVCSDGWSVYKENQQIISGSGFFRGVPDYNLVGSSVTTKIHPHRTQFNLKSGLYFWLGPIHGHFGHFLLSTLSRLWALRDLPRDIRIAYVGPPVEELFSSPFRAYVFATLGISKHRFVRIEGPTRFGKLVIAERSFNENHSISCVHKELMTRLNVARNIKNTMQRKKNDEYIYVSKHLVSKGVRSIENEEALCNYLSSKGIRCVSPEQMPFEKQIEFWAENSNFVGFSSSALHVSEICGGKNIIMINHSPMASVNHVLCDFVSENRTIHIYPNKIINKGKNENFSEVLKIHDVQEFGDALIRIIRKSQEKRILPQKTPLQLQSVSSNLLINEPLGENISRNGVASQSSVYDRDEGRSRNAEGAISGRLTGSYQCHTQLERDPWWQISFDDEYLFTEIRIYNRLDSNTVKNRSNVLSISVSTNGHEFSEVHLKRDESVSFGGASGLPYRWRPKTGVRGHVIRIKLSGVTYLHFDQVEIFGEKSDLFLGAPRAVPLNSESRGDTEGGM